MVCQMFMYLVNPQRWNKNNMNDIKVSSSTTELSKKVGFDVWSDSHLKKLMFVLKKSQILNK